MPREVDFITELAKERFDQIEWGITWHSYQDACHKCKNLNGYPFSGTEDFPTVLLHPQWGPVWDLIADHSLTHPNCRCQLEIYLMIDGKRYTLSEIQQYREQIKGLRAEVGQLHGGLQELEYLFYRVTSVMRRAGLSENYQEAVTQAQNWVLTGRMLQHAALYMASGTPFGLAMGFVAGAGVFLMLKEIGEENTRQLRADIAREQQQLLESIQISLRRQRY